MADVQDILIYTGEAGDDAWVSLAGPPGQPPEVNPAVEVTVGDCTDTPTAGVVVEYEDANGDITTDPAERYKTKLKFTQTVVPGCDGADGTTVTANGPHEATALDNGESPTVVIDQTQGAGTNDLKFTLGIPAGPAGKDGTSIEIIGTIDSPGGESGQGQTDLNDSYPDANNGDVVVDSNGNGWLSDGSGGWSDLGPFRGPDGKSSSFNNPPDVTTVACDQDASATVVKNTGDSSDTTNVYDLSFSIPKGCDGDDGLNAQVVKQSGTPTQDSDGEAIRMGCIWLKTST